MARRPDIAPPTTPADAREYTITLTGERDIPYQFGSGEPLDLAACAVVISDLTGYTPEHVGELLARALERKHFAKVRREWHPVTFIVGPYIKRADPGQARANR